ncbi:UNKNOWN [Stylonychia lemnae]|uniref:Uncharacterized protein n=1 Tax=Stylonychia lemnae TaxID=5949 RepID=A0A077ZW79_STYLE|nr:UNKNOWN [Stylonychia lemnae]|eukprot:CDW73836.1 UNKNOWN [Stylonychia lemnae]
MIIRLKGEQKVFEDLLNKMLQFNPALRIDAYQVLYELCKLSNQPLDKHLEIEEAKQDRQSSANYDCIDAFALTIKSTNAVINEIISKLGEFNYGAIDQIQPNKNRILMPLAICVDDGIYQGEYDNVNKQRDGRATQVSGKMINCMVMENTVGKLEVFMKDNAQITRKKDSDCLSQSMVINTLDNG